MDLLTWTIPSWVCLAFMALALLYIYGTCCMHTWEVLGYPGPPPVPFFGNAHQFFNPATGVRASVREWSKQYGKIFGVHFFRKPCLVISDMDAVKEILVSKFNQFPDRFFIGKGKIFPEVVLRCMSHQKGDGWRRLRKIMSSSFTSGKLRLLTAELNRTASQLSTIMFQDATSGTTKTKAKDVYSAYTLDVIAKTAFGLDANALADRNDEFSQTAQGLVKPTAGTRTVMAATGVFPLLGLLLHKLKFALFSPKNLRLFEISLTELVHQKKKRLGSLKEANFLQNLIQAELDPAENIRGDRKLSAEEIASQGIMFIYAGFETTSSTLQFMSYNLARYQDIQEKVVQEIKQAVGDAEEITYSHCEKMKYTEAVLNETLRLYPPVHILFREALEDTMVNGLHIPAKTGILIPVYNIGQDPELFPDPETFNPDRFLDEEKKNIAFGLGPKTCIGMRLAILEIKIAFVHLLRKVHLVDATPDKIEITDYTAFPSVKTPIYLSLKPRI